MHLHENGPLLSKGVAQGCNQPPTPGNPPSAGQPSSSSKYDGRYGQRSPPVQQPEPQAVKDGYDCPSGQRYGEFKQPSHVRQQFPVQQSLAEGQDVERGQIPTSFHIANPRTVQRNGDSSCGWFTDNRSPNNRSPQAQTQHTDRMFTSHNTFQTPGQDGRSMQKPRDSTNVTSPSYTEHTSYRKQHHAERYQMRYHSNERDERSGMAKTQYPCRSQGGNTTFHQGSTQHTDI